MSPAARELLVSLILSVGFSLTAYWCVRRSLRDLMSRTVTVPGGVDFYLRSFLLLLLFGAIGGAISSSPDLKPGARFMEYVWAIATRLGTVFGYVFGTLAIYLTLITVLVAALKPHNDK